MLALLQAGHHGLAGDGAKLVREGAVEDQNVHGEDPLADGCGVLQDKALVDKENTTWEEAEAKESRSLKTGEDSDRGAAANQSGAEAQTSRPLKRRKDARVVKTSYMANPSGSAVNMFRP